MTHGNRREFLRSAATAAALAPGATSTHAQPRQREGDPVVQLRANGISISGGRPHATVWTDSPDHPIAIKPTGSPVVTQRRRTTPAGRAVENSWLWLDATGFRLQWSAARLEARAGVILRAALTNGTGRPARVKEIVLCDTVQPVCSAEGDPAGWLLSSLGDPLRVGTLDKVLPSPDDPTWSGFAKKIPPELGTDPHWRIYDEFLTLYTAGGQNGVTIGPVGSPSADLRVDTFVAGSRFRLRIVSEMTGVLLEPGETREAQHALLLAEPYDLAIETILRWTAATHGARTHRPPPFGWCSWYDLLDKITADSIASTLRGAQDIRRQMPFDVYQIDMGWEKSQGEWQPNSKFPRGIAEFMPRIRAMGSIPGVWLAPLWVSGKAGGLLEDHPDWFQRKPGGDLAHEGADHYLDPTHPAVQEFLRSVIRQRRTEGFEYFKIDYNELSSDCLYHDPLKTRLQAFRGLYQLYREEIGESGYLLACSGFTRGVLGAADATRTGWDSRARWNRDPGQPPLCILEAMRAVGNSARANRIWFVSDPDVTYLKPRGTLTEAELRTWHGFVGLLGGAAMISEPIEKPEYRERLRMGEILRPPSPEAGRSFHGGADRDHQQFGFVAHRPWGDFAVLQIWNNQTRPTRIPLARHDDLTALGIRTHVWSFWDEQYLGIFDAGFRTPTLNPREALLIRLTPVGLDGGAPVVIGSTLHICIGAAEIARVVASSQSLDIALSDAGAREGAIYVHAPGTLRVTSAENCVATVSPGPNRVWAVRIGNRGWGGARILLQHEGG